MRACMLWPHNLPILDALTLTSETYPVRPRTLQGCPHSPIKLEFTLTGPKTGQTGQILDLGAQTKSRQPKKA